MSRKAQDRQVKGGKRNASSSRPVRKQAAGAKKAAPSSSRISEALASRNWRFYFIGSAFAALAMLSVWRIASHQVLAGEQGFEFLQAQGDARSLRTETITAHRGLITDRNGEPLAVSTPVVSIWAEPRYLLAASDRYPALAEALDTDLVSLEQRVARYADKSFMYLKRHLSPAEAQLVLDLDVDGVYAQREYRRFYPAREIAAHIVGFTNIDDQGQEGVELAYDDWLSGTSGQKRVLKDLKGRVIKDVQLIRSPEPGEDIQLSIDLRIQYLASEELKKAVKAHNARSGSMVLVDVLTGEILAMANYPTFNPNNRSRVSPSHLRNRAVTDVFEPGSTMKPLTLAAALESGKFDRSTVINTNPGYIRVSGKTLYDHNNYGLLDMTGIIRKSSQVGTTKIALELDPVEVRNLFYRMGLGQATGIGFPGESVGVLPSHRKWREIERVTFAFGHGLSVTALQLAEVYAVLANRGEKRPLSLLKVSEEVPPTEQVLAPEIAVEILEMMQSVTQKGGTGTRAAIPAFSVAGKTGTTHKLEGGAYSADKYVSVFAGIAPATNPRFAAVVMVDEPSNGDYYGGLVAAPVFREVVAGALRLVGVKPDNIREEKKLS